MTSITMREAGAPPRALHERGACRADGVGDLFFPSPWEDPEPAKAICRGCPVASECLRYALPITGLSGVWGGKTEGERRAIRRGASAPDPRGNHAREPRPRSPGKSWRHGTKYAYRQRGCRCRPCVAANTAACRRQRAARQAVA
jgi:WhiB family transcriptional regulator, redox-sensing transcriptional regulator